MTAADGRALAAKLDALPAPQRRLWEELGATPSDFVLCGGTAVALHLGHRPSVDFDFFGSRDFDPQTLFESVSYLRGGKIVAMAPNTLTVRVDRDGPVLLSFFGTPRLGRISAPLRAEPPGLRVASRVDLAALKVVVAPRRAQSKDYVDIDALIASGVDLPTAIAAAQIVQGSAFDAMTALKALVAFDDGDLPGLDDAVKRRLRAAVRAVDLRALPRLDYLRAYDEAGAA